MRRDVRGHAHRRRRNRKHLRHLDAIRDRPAPPRHRVHECSVACRISRASFGLKQRPAAAAALELAAPGPRSCVSNRTAPSRRHRYSRRMTQEPRTDRLPGDPPNHFSRVRLAVAVPTVDAGPRNDVIPTCPLCHTSTAAVTDNALREGAYWRCARCGQMWDAIRLQTAANYSRHAGLLLVRT